MIKFSDNIKRCSADTVNVIRTNLERSKSMNNGNTKVEPQEKEKNLRVHPSCKCSSCGKSQEDGVKIFDYYHIGEGVFCTECRNPNEK